VALRSDKTSEQLQGELMPLDVLIVDDSAAIRKILQRVLRQADVPVRQFFEAGDGAEALEALKTQEVGLILSDINMPNMDGLQLLGHLKANEAWKDIPVVMVTTEGSQAKVMEAVELGAAGYVRKPFTAEQIKEKLSGIVEL
jgi:two-component system chemotaxis response regulator CheY